MVSVNILLIHFKGLESKHSLSKSKAPSLSTSPPPLPQSSHQKCELLLLCTEYLYTQTHTLGSPWAVAQVPQHRCHTGCSNMLRPGQHRGHDHRTQCTGEMTKTSYFWKYYPSPWVEPDSRQSRRGQLGLIERESL